VISIGRGFHQALACLGLNHTLFSVQAEQPLYGLFRWLDLAAYGFHLIFAPTLHNIGRIWGLNSYVMSIILCCRSQTGQHYDPVQVIWFLP
jgi:hypothetical protein